MFIPIKNPKFMPMRLTINKSTTPSTPLISNFVSILIGHAKNLTTKTNNRTAIRKYPAY